MAELHNDSSTDVWGKILASTPLLSLLDKALILAVHYHSAQLDKQNKPYILHVLGVVNNCPSLDGKIVAALHDILEDTFCPMAVLRENFPVHIVEAVIALTKTSLLTYDEYIERLKFNRIAVEVKIADMQHNIGRMSGLSLYDQRRLLPKYLKSLETLQGTY